ncbi:GvpL/GvpF family gas vesicle protein [Sandaracinus amylolyticus]|uniref:Gas vesicle synthesis protein n=1 Tax=Sandaracinus amylolyticus TaxID=927083 RepID=A0A0F6SHC2_9BACT|nr:GvpL/GvpF family gas vesicle protein [Sandaracinus amylolyticus]AKF10189.1 hypothetical protein DB32_007338 [Sandaracinus amylolyticus]
MSVWWALAVVDRAPDALPSIDGARVEAFALGDHATLIAAELPAMPAAGLDALRRHDAAVRTLAEQVPAVLPVRFGAHASEPARLVERLRGREDALHRGLERVHGAVQVTVRAMRGPPLVVAPVDERDASFGPGARFLRQRARAPRPPGWDALTRALRPHVRAERVDEGDPRVDAWRVYHLVARDGEPAYRTELAHVVALVPDWQLVAGASSPPYAFAAEVLS